MFAVNVHFPLGGYEANRNDDLGAHEWPPCPDRLVSGLVSVAESAADVAALQWLESLAAPRIVASAPGDTRCEARSNYVVTNAIDRKGRSWGTLPGRSGGGTREWLRVNPADPTITYLWSESAVPDHVGALDDLCRRLPYLGRSTSPVVAELVADAPEPSDHDPTWVPDPSGTVPLTVPRAGLYDDLEDAFQNDQPPWSVARRTCRYAAPGTTGSVPDDIGHATPFEHREWIVFGVEGGRRPAYQHLVALTSAFRAAALSQAGDDAPYALHGHGATDGDTERVMFLGLPVVGSHHASGHLAGFAVSIPRSIDDAERMAVYRALVGIGEIRHRQLGTFRISRSGQDDRWALNPGRWTAAATTWVTAYPAVLDRFVHDAAEIAPTVLGMCDRVGLPSPIDIDWSFSPLIEGPDRLSARHTVRHPGDDRRKFVHLRLTFDRKVAGPIVLGHMRHFGLGLMLPDPERRARASAPVNGEGDA